MTRRSPSRKHPEADAVFQRNVVQSDTSAPTSGLTTLLESATQQILAVTYWFDPAPHSGPYPVTVRFSGRRIDVKGQLQQSDHFVQDETIENVIPGSGPISITARVRSINPGSWVVTAHILNPAHTALKAHKRENGISTTRSPSPIARFWRGWAPSTEPDKPMSTCLTPFVRVPGIFPGIWAVMVTLGIAFALLLQFLVISRVHLAVGPWWAVSLGAVLVGIVGAKTWFIFLYRREHRIEGWCIQGFVVSAVLTATILLVVLRVPAGVFLDATAPGLLVAMAIGRVGCFFAGCCGGPLTASRWGVWSSDQRVGARRIPTQLLESFLALSLGLGSLGAILSYGPRGGAFFVAALAAYTLVRQGILHVRAEPRRTRLGEPITAILSALLLIATLVFLVW